MFVQLHLHNHLGSRLDGIGSPEDYAQRAMELNHPALAVTDHGRVNSFYEHQVKCLQYGIKPIFGVEMYVVDKLVDMKEDGKRKRTKTNHLIILVKDKIGYNNLLKLNYLSVKDADHFYYVPRITLKELFEHKEGLIIGTGCMANPISRLVLDDKTNEAEDLFYMMTNELPHDLYVEIQLNELKEQKIINDFMIRMANKIGIPIVITGDVHYLKPGQDKLQTLAIAIRDKATIDNIKFELESKHLFYHDISDYVEFNKKFKYGYEESDIINWCHNTLKVADECNFLIPERDRLFIPQLTDNDESLLIKRGKEGLANKFSVPFEEVPKEYKDRLKKELEIIIRKGFASYFLIVDDITQFSVRENIYGRIGRGSVGGSLLAYALGIHNLDPIKKGLLFERFLSDSRTSDLVVDYFG